jgi:hypothetical protein
MLAVPVEVASHQFFTAMRPSAANATSTQVAASSSTTPLVHAAPGSVHVARHDHDHEGNDD